METSIPDFWPETFSANYGITPKTVLLQQASLLGEKTQNIIVGEVRSQVEHTSLAGAGVRETLVHGFYIVAPALNSYRRRLLQVAHDPVEFYPCYVSSDVDVPERQQFLKCGTQAEYEAALRGIFQSPKTSSIVTALLAQSR